MEDVVHHPLERRRRIGEPKEHNGRLIQALIRAEGGLLLIPFLDPDVVVSPTNVKLREVLGSPKLVDEFQNERKQVAILDRHFVELLVVLDRSQRAVLFLDEEERRGEW